MSSASRTGDQIDPKWIELQKKVDWMALEPMHSYVNELATEIPGTHWADFLRERFIEPLLVQSGAPLRMAVISPGTGSIELSLMNDFKWPIEEITLYEFDDSLKVELENKFNALEIKSNVVHYDLNFTELPKNEYDVIFISHSMHHATNLKFAISQIKSALRPEGLFLGIDYFGPTRFQIEHEVWEILERLDRILPEKFKFNLDPNQKEITSQKIKRLTWDEIIEYDISEAPHSSDLRTLLFSQFKVKLKRPMGGTLLRWLLNNRAGNFDLADANHVAILQLLIELESNLIKSRNIHSDDLMFVLTR